MGIGEKSVERSIAIQKTDGEDGLRVGTNLLDERGLAFVAWHGDIVCQLTGVGNSPETRLNLNFSSENSETSGLPGWGEVSVKEGYHRGQSNPSKPDKHMKTIIDLYGAKLIVPVELVVYEGSMPVLSEEIKLPGYNRTFSMAYDFTDTLLLFSKGDKASSSDAQNLRIFGLSKARAVRSKTRLEKIRDNQQRVKEVTDELRQKILREELGMPENSAVLCVPIFD